MQQFQFNPLQLATPRRFGISAVMRIKNGGEFLEATIRSHLPYFDEIVACYNNCNDNTAEILQQLVLEFPNKIRMFHYEPRVHPILSQEHKDTETFSIHSMANYYNFSLAQCRYQIATKLDDDHLAIAANMQAAVDWVRHEYRAGRRNLFRFSGLNLAGDRHNPLIYRTCPLVGTGDIMFFPLDPQIYFVQAKHFETLQFGNLKNKLAKHYLGILYCHLKHLKTDYGFGNLSEPCKTAQIAAYQRSCRLQTLGAFTAPDTQQQLIAEYGALAFRLRQSAPVRWMLKLLNKQQPLRFARLQCMPQDIAGLNWQQDVLQWLQPQSIVQPDLRRYG